VKKIQKTVFAGACIMLNNEKVVVLLYLLIRDHLPAGEVIKVVNDIRDMQEEITFTNKDILSLASSLADRLRTEI
jgi:hypothetical protein